MTGTAGQHRLSCALVPDSPVCISAHPVPDQGAQCNTHSSLHVFMRLKARLFSCVFMALLPGHPCMLSLLSCTAAVSVLGGGEASGPLSPPEQLSEEYFSAGEAAAAAYEAAGLGPQQVDYWGLYDCFPVCFVRSVLGVLTHGPCDRVVVRGAANT